MKRKALYDLVWSVPADRLAGFFRLSGRGLGKICERGNIPLPPRGYWAKLAAGKPVKRTLLPPLGPGEREWVWIALPGTPQAKEGREWVDREVAAIAAREGWGDPLKVVVDEEPRRPEFQEDLHAVVYRALESIGAARVKATELKWKLHPAVKALVEEDARRRPDAWKPYSPQPVFRSPGPRRRLAFANALLLAGERAGVTGTLDPEGRRLMFTVGHQGVAVGLVSTWMKKAGETRSAERLDVHVYEPQYERTRFSWLERWNERPEEQVAPIAAGIIVSGELQARESQVRSYRELGKLWERQQEAAEAARQERKAKARAELIAQATAHRQASEIRQFVADAEKTAGEESMEFLRWRHWALAEADELDPLRGEGLRFE